MKRSQDAEAKARQLMDQAGIGKVVPIDPVQAAAMVGIRVQLVRFKDPTISGILRSNQTIYVNYADDPKRQRFTIAHELGHSVLHGPAASDLYRSEISSWGTDPKEIEANSFAAALLMPEDLVRKYWENGIRDAADLARLFEVSEQSMRIRLNVLGLWK